MFKIFNISKKQLQDMQKKQQEAVVRHAELTRDWLRENRRLQIVRGIK